MKKYLAKTLRRKELKNILLNALRSCRYFFNYSHKDVIILFLRCYQNELLFPEALTSVLFGAPKSTKKGRQNKRTPPIGCVWTEFCQIRKGYSLRS